MSLKQEDWAHLAASASQAVETSSRKRTLAQLQDAPWQPLPVIKPHKIEGESASTGLINCSKESPRVKRRRRERETRQVAGGDGGDGEQEEDEDGGDLSDWTESPSQGDIVGVSSASTSRIVVTSILDEEHEDDDEDTETGAVSLRRSKRIRDRNQEDPNRAHSFAGLDELAARHSASRRARVTRTSVLSNTFCHDFPVVAPQCVDPVSCAKSSRTGTDDEKDGRLAWYDRDCWMRPFSKVGSDTPSEASDLRASLARGPTSILLEYGAFPGMIEGQSAQGRLNTLVQLTVHPFSSQSITRPRTETQLQEEQSRLSKEMASLIDASDGMRLCHRQTIRDVFVDVGGALGCMDVLVVGGVMYVAAYATGEAQGCLVQIWRVGLDCSAPDDGEESAVVVCCFVHHGGDLSDLKWHQRTPSPSGKLFLAACSIGRDASVGGSLDVYALDLEALGDCGGDGACLVDLEPVVRLRTATMNMTTCEWCPHHSLNLLAAGTREGLLVVWDMDTVSQLLSTEAGAAELCNVHSVCHDTTCATGASTTGSARQGNVIRSLAWMSDYPFHCAVLTNDARLMVYNVSQAVSTADTSPLFVRCNHRRGTSLTYIPGTDLFLAGSEKWRAAGGCSAATLADALDDERYAIRDPSAMLVSLWPRKFYYASARSRFVRVESGGATDEDPVVEHTHKARPDRMGAASMWPAERFLVNNNRTGWDVCASVRCSGQSGEEQEEEDETMVGRMCSAQDGTVHCAAAYSDGTLVSCQQEMRGFGVSTAGVTRRTQKCCDVQIVSQAYLRDWIKQEHRHKADIYYGGPLVGVRGATHECAGQDKVRQLSDPLGQLKRSCVTKLALDHSVAMRRVFEIKPEAGGHVTHFVSAGARGIVRVQTLAD